MLGAGSVLQSGQRVPAGELWMGSPARFVRKLADTEKEFMKQSAERYHRLAMQHQDEFYLDGNTPGMVRERESLEAYVNK